MLIKLMKYEFKATGRLFLPFFGAILLLAAFNRLLFLVAKLNLFVISLDLLDGLFSIVLGLSLTLYCVGVGSSFLVPHLFSLIRFGKTMFKNEGYLTHTLPVSVHQLLLSKLITSLIWIFACTIVTALSIVIMIAGSLTTTMREMFLYVYELVFPFISTAQFQTQVLQFGIELLLLAVVSVPYLFLMAYFAITVGSIQHKLKILCGIGTFLGVYFAYQTICSLIIFALSMVYQATGNVNVLAQLHLFYQVVIVTIAVITVLLYLFTHRLIHKKLNLE